MIKRLFWLVVGVGAGAAVGIAVTRWTGKAAARYSPGGIASRASAAVAELGDRVRDALDAGREEMVVREAELRRDLHLDDPR
ncbi:MAG TPA: hypothetical protein VGB83_05195 [Actinomycetota bacterium]